MIWGCVLLQAVIKEAVDKIDSETESDDKDRSSMFGEEGPNCIDKDQQQEEEPKKEDPNSFASALPK